MNNIAFDDYQKQTRLLAVYKDIAEKSLHIPYVALGLSGETAELLDKAFSYLCTLINMAMYSGNISEHVKKLIRDSDSIMNDEIRDNIKKELGDVLWYAARIADESNLSFGEVASFNLDKLYSRKARGKIHGKGDDR